MINLKNGITESDITNITNTRSTVTAIETTVNNVETNVTNNTTIVDELNTEIDREFHHKTCIFPEQSNATCTLTAGAVANTFSGWAELIDSAPVKLSSRDEAGYHMHISGIMLEDASKKDEVYVIEFAYGITKTAITRQRFMAGNVKVGTTQAIKVRAEHIPYGELIYYRMRAETALATCQINIRFHLDEE